MFCATVSVGAKTSVSGAKKSSVMLLFLSEPSSLVGYARSSFDLFVFV
jgi:hypothetical protein